MKVTKKDLKNSRVQLTVELSAEIIAKSRKNAFAEIAKDMKFPGFRAGHAPEEMIIEKVGEQTIQAEAERLAISHAYTQAIHESKLLPISQPKLEVTKDTPLTFIIEFDVYPQVTLGKYKDVKVSVKEEKVEKKEIDAIMTQLQNEVKDYKEVDRKAKNEDAADIDFEGFTLDGEPVPNTKGEGYTLILGSKQFIPGFEEEVVGMKKGEEKTFEITFPKDYHAAHMAGQKYKFKVTVHAVKEPTMPEINEEFVEKITGTKNTVASLEEEIRKNLEIKKYQEARIKAEEELLAKLSKEVKVELPASMIDEEVHFLVDNVKMQGLQQGMPWAKYLEMMKKTEEEMRKDLTKNAEERVLYRVVIQEIMKQENIQVAESDIEGRVGHAFSHLRPEDQKKRKDDYKKGGKQYEQMRNMMMVEALFNSYLGKPKRDEHAQCNHDHDHDLEHHHHHH